MFPMSKKIELLELTEANYHELLPLRNSDSYILNCTYRKHKVSQEELLRELTHDFGQDRHKQVLAYHRVDNTIMGTIYSYSYSPIDGYLFVTTYIADSYTKKGYGAEVFLLFTSWLLNLVPDLRKIYLDVYDFNLASIKTIERCGARLEGRFYEHRLVPGYGYRDLLRFALYMQDWGNERVTRLLKHFEIL
jgi:RimJ/RimL family protein N-acetyltransferase